MDFGYDEFGNRTAVDEEDTGQPDHHNGNIGASRNGGNGVTANNDHSRSSSHSSFSDDVELVIGETAQQSIDQPLVEASAIEESGRRARARGHAQFLIEDQRATETALLLTDGGGQAAKHSVRFIETVGAIPSRRRNVALVGCLHHGKTSLLNMLLRGKSYRGRPDEVDREISLKSHVIATVAGGSKIFPTSHLISFVDTPGHPDFIGEVAAALRLVDAVLFCVDAVESLTAAGERLLRQAVVNEQLPIILVITKVDRLVLELKLPPSDAYRKLRTVIDAVNNCMAGCGSRPFLVSPENGTVCFSSSQLSFFFSLETFALKYAEVYSGIEAASLTLNLWGHITFDNGSFKRITNFRQRPSFVTFVLEPLYKIMAHSVTGEGSRFLSPELSHLPRSPMDAMKEAMQHFCGDPAGEGLDVLLAVLPATETRSFWLAKHYALPESFQAEETSEGSDDTTVVAIAPLLCMLKEGEPAAVVRVVRGPLRCGSLSTGGGGCPFVVMDEHCNEVDPYYMMQAEGMYVRTAEEGFVPLQVAYEGQIVYLTGICKRSGSHLLLVGGHAAHVVEAVGKDDYEGPSSLSWLDQVRVFPFLQESPLVHVAVELKDPTKLLVVQDALQTLRRTTPGLDVHKEETGEFVLTGFGELHLDSALHELRRGLCAGVKMGLSQPFVSFSETVRDEEGILAVAGTRKTGIGCVSGVLPPRLAEAVEYERVKFFPTDRAEVVKLWTTLRNEYDMDAFASRRVMALGPDKTKGPSLLFDDTLEEEQQHPLTQTQRNVMASAFRATLAAGPLTGDVVRGVGVKLIFADVEEGVKDAVVLSNTRSAVRQSLLGARPRLLEPVLSAEILCSADCMEKLKDILQLRRGAVIGETPVAATTLVRVHALVPLIDSFGLETQMRMLSHGQAFPFFSFAQWDEVPGDPFDATVRVAPMEPAKGYQLARDFVLKTRFRKGLPANLMADY